MGVLAKGHSPFLSQINTGRTYNTPATALLAAFHSKLFGGLLLGNGRLVGIVA